MIKEISSRVLQSYSRLSSKYPADIGINHLKTGQLQRICIEGRPKVVFDLLVGGGCGGVHEGHD